MRNKPFAAGRSALYVWLAVIAVVCLLAYGPFRAAEATGQPEMSAEQIYAADAEALFYLKVYKEDGSLKTVGSGFLIGRGLALTAAHVVQDGASYEAVFGDGKSVKGLVLQASDADTDVAVLSIQAGARKTLELAAGAARSGQRVYALGYPLKGTPIITEGIVNAPAAQVNGVSRLLTSAQIASGMSGGPLLDADGRVAGIVSGSFRTMDNIHLCAPLKDISKLLQEVPKK